MRLRDLSEVTQLVRTGVGIQTQASARVELLTSSMHYLQPYKDILRRARVPWQETRWKRSCAFPRPVRDRSQRGGLA